MDHAQPVRQVGPATVIAAVYGLAYLAFERAGLGSESLRDLLGTAAFMPLNLLASALAFAASRERVLDASVRRALCWLAWGGLAVFALSLAKIFLYDLASLSSVARAFSFILVGALLLAGGFFLQRLSDRLGPRPPETPLGA